MADFEKPSNTEDEYFAREDVEKKRKLAIAQAEALAAQQREERKKLHYLKCPKCGMDLQTLKRGQVEVDTCFNCHGVWLDAGELETILEGNDGERRKVVEAVFNIFRKK